MIRLCLFLLIVAPGCKSRNAPAKVTASEVKRTIPINGFDPQGEPEIREMSDGSLQLWFNFMPPSFAPDDDKRWASFDKDLARELGVAVVQDDREVFLIRAPRADTIERLKRYLASRAHH